MSDVVDELKLLIRSRHPIITIETDEEQRAVARIMQAADSVSIRVYRWNLIHGLRATPPEPVQSIAQTQKPGDVLAHVLAQTFAAVFVMEDLCPHLKDATLQRMLRTFGDCGPDRHQTMVLVDPTTDLPPVISRIAVPLEFRLPDEPELEQIVRDTFKELSRYSKIRQDLTKEQFRQILQNMRGLTAQEAKLAISRVILDDDCLDGGDIDRLLAVKREMIREAGLLEYIDPGVRVEDLGGLARLKDWLSQRDGALASEARAYGLDPPRGILLLGVQGCGKSLACKTVAALWRMPLLKLDPGQLYDKFVGESERNLRKAIRLAESMAPAVLWIDEIEKAFASA
ncbi:MAG TPA: AAA family ATPase, partial [Phycisphaerae bacterium]